jgi:hypothetical protein
MIRTAVFAALSLAVVLGGASGAVAASKKAHEAFASGSAGTPADPRDTYQAKRKSNSFLTWCDADPSCNGWGDWQRLVSAGKIKP